MIIERAIFILHQMMDDDYLDLHESQGTALKMAIDALEEKRLKPAEAKGGTHGRTETQTPG